MVFKKGMQRRRRPVFRRRRFRPMFSKFRYFKRAAELKYADFQITTAIASDAPVITELTAIAQGDTQSTRTGNKITIKSIHLRGNIFGGNAATMAIVRNIMVIDRQQVSDTDPTFAQLLLSSDVNSNLSLNSAGRFKILMDKTNSVQQDADGTSKIWLINKYMKFPKGIQVRYNGANATDIQKNGVFIFQISDVPAAAEEPIQTLNIRVGFTDY